MEFSIAGKALKLTTKEDIQPYLDDLVKHGKISKIDLNGNTIGIEASKALADTITSNKSILENVTEINFADLYTSRLVDEVVQSLEFLLPALLNCKKLKTINLSDNAFGLRTIDSLEKFIANAIQIENIILSNNGMGPFAGERIGKALYKLSQNKLQNDKPLLSSFICGRNRLENGSSIYLALGLKAHAQDLKIVKLYQNGIRPLGIMNLIEFGLKFCTNLETIDLQDNTFTAKATIFFSDYLFIWKEKLIELNLNDCLLKPKGADKLVENLKNFSKLKVLKLEYNELIQDTIEKFLVPYLENNHLPNLETLQLNGNILDEDSDAMDFLQGKFPDMEIDDLEEIDSDAEDEDDDESDDEIETFEKIDTDKLQLALDELVI